MMSIENSKPKREQLVASARSDMLAQILEQDWRRLFPWRKQYRESICQVLATSRAGGVNARAAFGVLGPELASPWLYRDFYLDSPPDRPSIDHAIGKLRRGNPRDLLDALAAGRFSEHTFRRVWYEVSTLAGRILGTVVVERGGVTRAGDFEVMPRPSTLPARVVNEAKVVGLLQHALTGPIGVEPHRRNLLEALGNFAARSLSSVAADHTLALLVHHLDFTPRKPLRWSRLGGHEQRVIHREVSALTRVIGSPPAFLEHLHAGLRSPWRQRRFLCYRLLRLDGHLDRHVHPDDYAVTL